MDPYQDTNAFHDFIKKSLHVDFTKTQLMDKIRRLKKKYENNLGRGNKGEDRNVSKLHERHAYDLSKKLWGNGSTNGVLESVENVRHKLKRIKTKLNYGAKEGEKMDIDNDNVGMAGLEEFVISQVLHMIGGQVEEAADCSVAVVCGVE
ncbi:hypothetical protein Patl1_34633 [Pistacia atlantica]|uniref:Uncharacterized protein n=1 Tax=Pistacia atlantica TaxID=434234 RepID=A0ACC0ZT36_9ROSI|nr:hypothetical protein Patl1_34633 [Pistacia atlantica]